MTERGKTVQNPSLGQVYIEPWFGDHTIRNSKGLEIADVENWPLILNHFVSRKVLLTTTCFKVIGSLDDILAWMNQENELRCTNRPRH
jgi:hypothetical protein